MLRALAVVLLVCSSAFAQSNTPPAAQLPGSAGVAGGQSARGSLTLDLPTLGCPHTLAANEWWPGQLVFTGALGADCTVTLPANDGQDYEVFSLTTGGHNIIFAPTTTAAITLSAGATKGVRIKYVASASTYVVVGSASLPANATVLSTDAQGNPQNNGGVLPNAISGNAATATSLAAAPKTCTNPAPISTGIAADGTAFCTSINSPTLVSGYIANIPFDEGQGTVAKDTTGNHNDLTFASGNNAPTWVAGGIALNQQTDLYAKYASFPALASLTSGEIGNARTVIVCTYIAPVQPIAQFSAYPTLIGNSVNTAPTYGLFGGFAPGVYYLPSIWGGEALATYSNQTVIGNHCIGYVLGSYSGGTDYAGYDHLFIDDSEVSYTQQCTQNNQYACSYDRRTVGNLLTLGCMNWASGGGDCTRNPSSSYMMGRVNYIVAYDRPLSPAEMAQNANALKFLAFQSRGVGVPTPVNYTYENLLIVDGDSIASLHGHSGITDFPERLSSLLNVSFTVKNVATAGFTLLGDVGQFAETVYPYLSPLSHFLFALEEAGINDLTYSQTPAQVISNRMNFSRKLRALGVTSIQTTMLSSQAHDTVTPQINAALRASASVEQYLVVDWANNPNLGAPGAYSSSTWFQDGLHPTQQGQDEMAQEVANVLNWATSEYTQDSPHVVTDAAYTIVAADKNILAQGTGSQTLTLPTCYGYNATTPFRVTNGSSRTATVTVPSGFALNGSTAGSVTLSPWSSATFYSALNPNLSGCSWLTR